MTRDEVLSQLDSVANSAFAGSVVSADVCRAAAEIIRESGWRPIAEAPGDEWATYGKWVLRRVAFVWEEFHTTNKQLAIDSGFTHYLSKPAPPAREVENG